MNDLRFGPDDESAFHDARDRLADAFRDWLDDRRNVDRESAVSDAELLLDWRWGYSTGELDRFTAADLREFLLEWCPRKLSAPPDLVDEICPNLEQFVHFMDDTGQLDRASAPATVLIDELDRIRPRMRDAMADESMFGMAKSLFSGLGDLPDSQEELQALLEQRMDAHNALPFEERRAITDAFLVPDEPEPVELGFTHLMPSSYAVRRAAATAPIMTQLDALRDHLGPQGRPLTKKGNPKLDDARALVDLLGTGDAFDPRIGEHQYRTGSSQELPRLTFLLEWAVAARAIRRVKGTMVPVKAWPKADVLERAERLVEKLLWLGPLSGQRQHLAWFGTVHAILEEGIGHWLATMISPTGGISFEVIVELGVDTVEPHVPAVYLGEGAPTLERMVRRDIGLILEMLQLAGVVTWDDQESTTDEFDQPVHAGGIVRATALGHHLAPDLVTEAGYRFDVLADLDDVTTPELLDLVAMDGVDPERAVARWRQDRPASERAGAIAEVLIGDLPATQRIAAFELLGILGPREAQPAVESMLAGSSLAAGHAALFLLAHELADPDDLAPLIGVGPMVDALSLVADDPDELVAQFRAITEDGDPFDLLDQMWRCEQPETAVVLDTIGSHLNDKRVAKAARKAAVRHRSRMADRR